MGVAGTIYGVAELNGVLVQLDQMAALALVNYGHFTSFRVEDGLRVRGLTLHLERLVRDCRRLFDAPLDPDRVRYLVRHALVQNGGPITVRVTVFDPALPLGHPGSDAHPHILVTTRAVASTAAPALRLRSTCYRRDLPEVKHVGLFGPLHQRRLAQRAGFDDVLFTNPDTTICELATSNIGIIDGDRIVWPDADWLPGVTMRLLDQGRSDVRLITVAQLRDVEAVFATNAAAGVRPVRTIDAFHWPVDHPRLRSVAQRYAEIQPEAL